MKLLKVIVIILNLYVGGFLIYGSTGKFKETPKVTEIVDKVKNGEEVAPNEDVLKIKNYIFGMKQTGYMWPFLGVVELLAGLLLVSQVFARIGALIALPITVNIFLFHLFLEPHETGGLFQTLFLMLINVLLIATFYKVWKPLVINRAAIKFS